MLLHVKVLGEETAALRKGAESLPCSTNMILVTLDDLQVHLWRQLGEQQSRTGKQPSTDYSDTRLTYSGIAVLHPDLLAGMAPGRFPLAPLFSSAADAGRLAGTHYQGIWLDVGTPERLAAAAAL